MNLSFINRACGNRAIALAVSGLMLLPVLSTGIRAQDQGEIVDTDTSPYHRALLAYKAAKYQEALDSLDAATEVVPSADIAKVAILRSKILGELHRFDEGEKLLRSLLTPTGPIEIQMALGDLYLRKRSFDHAEKYYSLALQAKPNDPDITLKLIYAKIGTSDLVGAGKYASQLTPIDPKNPYDDHASYYFAQAAIAEATGKLGEAEDDIQAARTNCGITVTNRYLKTYLQVFAKPDSSQGSNVTPPPLIKPTPADAKP